MSDIFQTISLLREIHTHIYPSSLNLRALLLLRHMDNFLEPLKCNNENLTFSND